MYALFIDSSHRVSGTSTDFTVQFHDTVIVEDRAQVRVDAWRIPLADTTVNSTNRYLYVAEVPKTKAGGGAAQPILRVVTLVIGNYSGPALAQHLAKQLSEGSASRYTCTYSTNTGDLTINSADYFHLFGDEELKTWERQWPEDATGWRPKSFNSALRQPVSTRLGEKMPPIGGTTYYRSLTSTYPTLRVRDFYIRSSTLMTDLRSTAPEGGHDVIAKASVNTVGQYILTGDSPQHLWLKTGPICQKDFRFEVTDDRGEPVDLQGLPVSFVVSIEQSL